MDPFLISSLVSAGSALGGILSNSLIKDPELPAFKQAPTAPGISAVNQAARGTDMYGYAKNFLDPNSDYYRKIGQKLNTDVSASGLGFNQYMQMGRKSGLGSGFSSMLAKRGMAEQESKRHAANLSGLLGAQQQGAQLGMQGMQSAYDIGDKTVGRAFDRDMANWKGENQHSILGWQAKVAQQQNKRNMWGNLANTGMGIGMQGMTNWANSWQDDKGKWHAGEK